MHRVRHPLALALCLFSTVVFADYGWIPEYQNFQIRTGVDVSSTSNNFDNSGLSLPPRVAGNPVFLQDTTFWVQPEYGIAEDWSMGFKAGFLSGAATRVTGGALAASGTGFTDLWGSLKYRVSKLPMWTIEGVFKLPTGNAVAVTTADLVTGEGNLDVGAKLHYGLHEGHVFLSVSPGFLGRFGGYAPALTLDAAAQIFILRAYAKAFVN